MEEGGGVGSLEYWCCARLDLESIVTAGHYLYIPPMFAILAVCKFPHIPRPMCNKNIINGATVTGSLSPFAPFLDKK